MHTPDFTDDNVARIAAFFPNCVTETADENGNLKRAIDFDLLKQELSGNIVEGPKERYHLDWPGKRESLLTANAPIAKTFRPCREESVDFDTTKNLYVEGDNLDALKLLQETYLGKVKMIYIDPPYNTGNDFIYEDDFAEDKDAYFQKSMQTDEEGNRLVANTESNGRFHSDWLSMMYPRLKLARNLLRDDGVIFISIDDNEQANLKRLCDEVFGEENFVAQITRATGTPTGGGGAKAVVNESDFLLVYSKSQGLKFTGTRLTEEESAIYDKEDEQGIYLIRPLRRTGGEDRREDRPTMYYSLTAPDNTEIFPIAPAGYESRWICGKDKFDDLSKRGLIEWKKSQSGEWNVYQKFYLEGRLKQPGNLWTKVEGNKKATRDVRDLFGGKKIFDFPKPVGFIVKILQIATSNENDLVLDFFSGAATTAHAVMQLNAEDAGNRRFIMVQLPEETDEKSEACKAGYKTIAEIGKERIRRAGKQIKEKVESEKAKGELPLLDADSELTNHESRLDIGFRVLKIDSSNMKDVYYSPDNVEQASLLDAVTHIKEDRTAEDLLFQVLVDWGVDLSLPIAAETILGKQVFFVDEDAIAACFETGVTVNLVETIAKRKPLRAVFLDTGFDGDDTKINVAEIFKLLSPSTELRTI